MRPFYLIVPESFHPAEFLKSPKLSYCMEDAEYFISVIMTKIARGQVDRNGVVRLRAEYLKNIMDQRYYAAVIDALLEGEAVDRWPYTPGRRSFGYLPSTRFEQDRHVRRPVTDQRLIRRLEKFHRKEKRARRARMKPVHHALERQQKRLQINGDQAREIISTLPPKSNRFDAQGMRVSAIENQEFRVSVGRYGRLANNITSLKREVRETLKVGEQPLSTVDVSCCQPCLLAKLIRETERGTNGASNKTDRATRKNIYDSTFNPPIGSDFELYKTLVQNGKLYKYLISELKRVGHEISERALKRRILADVIAKKKVNRRGDEYPSEVEHVFRRLFSPVYAFIRRVNGEGWEHANLIRELQRMESALVIETVCQDLVTQYPQSFFITIHDSVHCLAEDLPRVERAFMRSFQEMDFQMKLKVEAC